MSQNFRPGDFLVFQLEAGFALLRLLAIDETDDGKVWHLAAYNDFFPDVESAESRATGDSPDSGSGKLSVILPHVALTNRAFESTQVARIVNVPLTDDEVVQLQEWRNNGDREVSDRSVRLLMGFR